MTAPNQLILVPPGIANFRPGIHRVVASSERVGQFVALFWLAEADKEGKAGPPKHCRKPRVHSWRVVAQHLENKMFQYVPEMASETSTPSNRYRDSVLERISYARNKAILTGLVEPDTLVAMLCYDQWKTKVNEAAVQSRDYSLATSL
jgi:putative transposase